MCRGRRAAGDRRARSTIVPGQSVAQRAVALREIGLFSDRAALSDAALGSEVERGVAERWEGAIGPDDPLIELAVAEQDANRVWWQDLEADVLDGNDVYEWTLGRWSAISAGTFMPENVVESWASETGPVTVAFELAGEPHVLTPAYLEDWIDPDDPDLHQRAHRTRRPAVRAVPGLRPDRVRDGLDGHGAHGARTTRLVLRVVPTEPRLVLGRMSRLTAGGSSEGLSESLDRDLTW